jgi:hypothetical protein
VTPQAAINEARIILSDPSPSPRYSDAVLLGYFNDFLKELAKRKRELFHEIVDISLVSGEFQSVPRSSTNGLIEVIRNSDLEAVHVASRRDIELQIPDFRRLADTRKPINWCKTTDGNDFDFMVYPPAQASDTVRCIVAQVPADVAIGDIAADLLRVSSNYRASAATYIAGRAISINTSSVEVNKGIALVNAGLEML